MNDALRAALYDFDDADAELTLLPMAARRALDLAGMHLSLVGWKELSLAERRELVLLGARDEVELARVEALLGDPALAVVQRSLRPDPAPDAPRPELVASLGATRPLPAELWARLSPLDRYVLEKLGSRGRLERLALAYDEIVARRS